MPPARTHFCTDVARTYAGVSSPTKYGLNGTMPEFVKSSDVSCGIRLDDGTTVCATRGEEPDVGLAQLLGGPGRHNRPGYLSPQSKAAQFACAVAGR